MILGIRCSVEILDSLPLSRTHGFNLIPSPRTANTVVDRIFSNPRDLTVTSVARAPPTWFPCHGRQRPRYHNDTFCYSIFVIADKIAQVKDEVGTPRAETFSTQFRLVCYFSQDSTVSAKKTLRPTIRESEAGLLCYRPEDLCRHLHYPTPSDAKVLGTNLTNFSDEKRV